jgi:hypothetical protein
MIKIYLIYYFSSPIILEEPPTNYFDLKIVIGLINLIHTAWP